MSDEELQTLSSEELKLIDSFRKLHAHPKADSPEDLIQWMSQYTMGAIKKEDTGASMGSSFQPSLPTSLILTQPPRLPFFSGDGKGDVDFDQWKYEYECLSKSHDKSVLAESIRRSLRGKAARVAMHVDKNAPIETLVSKLDSVFGNVKIGHSLMAQFYTAKQRDDESVAEWSCRLEDILCQAVGAGKVAPEETQMMLRNTFWTGLRAELRDLSGHKFDQSDTFEDFLRIMRQVEEDLQQRKPRSDTKLKLSTHGKAAVYQENPEIKEIKGILKQMSSEFAALKKQCQPSKDTGNIPQPQMPLNYYPPATNIPVQNWNQQGPLQPNEPVCFCCGRPGHIKNGCRVKLPSSNSHRNLNFNRPMGRGRP